MIFALAKLGEDPGDLFMKVSPSRGHNGFVLLLHPFVIPLGWFVGGMM